MRRVIVVGGGAAGMMAAIAAAKEGAAVDLYEKNEKTGKKIYITGKGRCNVTNACPEEDFFAHVCSNARFLYSSFYGFSNRDVQNFFEEAGCPLKVERGERVFPLSDHSSDIIQALNRVMKRLGVSVHLNTGVKELCVEEAPGTEDPKAPTGRIEGVKLMDGTVVLADAVIVCTGGLSYATTGSTGDGFRFAKSAGLKVSSTSPSLVPLNIAEEDIPAMQGLSLKNVKLKVGKGKKTVYEGFGEMMFTHFGITGPLVLTASTVLEKALAKGAVEAEIDLKPALSDEQLSARILREFEANKNRQFGNIIGALLPSKMVDVVIQRSGIPGDKRVHDITKKEREGFMQIIRHFKMTITSLRGYNEAVITKGGVAVKQIRPDTMETKCVKGLYFAGEVLDLDAVTGGYNLQIAWSTGYAAGKAAGREEEI